MAVIDFSRAADSRGNRLSRWSLLQDTKQHDVDYVCVGACDDVVDHFESCIFRYGGHRIDPETFRTPDGSRWDHVFSYPRVHRGSVRDLVALLSDVLTLTSMPELTVALALDFHKRGLEGGGFENTEAGELMARTKYWKDPTANRTAGSLLCDRLADVISRDPLYAGAGLIVAVPSTKSGLSERIARSVAERVHKPCVTAIETTGSRRENKAGTAGVIPKQYKAPDECIGLDVIVVDDLYRSGDSMRGVAAAVKAAQSGHVYGLVATRTLRRT